MQETVRTAITHTLTYAT